MSATLDGARRADQADRISADALPLIAGPSFDPLLERIGDARFDALPAPPRETWPTGL